MLLAGTTGAAARVAAAAATLDSFRSCLRSIFLIDLSESEGVDGPAESDGEGAASSFSDNSIAAA